MKKWNIFQKAWFLVNIGFFRLAIKTSFGRKIMKEALVGVGKEKGLNPYTAYRLYQNNNFIKDVLRNR